MRLRLRAGDRDAFGDLYEAHVKAVHRHALRLTGDWSTAEEVVSETFFAAWRQRGRLEEEGGSVKPWLLGIATHKAHNANRGLRRRLAFLARRPATTPVDDIADAVAARVDGARSLAAVHEALARLPRRDREVLALCVGEHLDHGQVAEALGVPVGTVRSRLSRARTRLRRLSERAATEQAAAERAHTERAAPGRASAERGPTGQRPRRPEKDDIATLTVALRLAEEPR
ncbi:RNA polymerase sigma factor [Streptomyces sp. NPDC005925]|uniref:RNA polymerase sigma factor n=1 Tax=Streptomyces sp. NPDC005925 TaxID=3157172 RepID=UPI0033D522D7